MDPESQLSINTDALLREELTAVETRELLSRLSVEEFGGSENPTVSAVCEATGTGPDVIGRMLADIRQQNLKELFGAKILEHTIQLDSHQKEISQLQTQPRPTFTAPSILEDPQIQEEIRQTIKDRARQREFAPLATVIAVALFLLFMLWAFNSQERSKQEHGFNGSGQNTSPNFPR